MLSYNAIGGDAVGAGSSQPQVQGMVCTIGATSILVASFASNVSLYSALTAASSVTATLAANLSLSCTLSAGCTVQGKLQSQQVVSMFNPSTARTVSVQAASPLFVAGKFWNLTDPNKPRGVKDPDATIDVTFDWVDWLADVGSPDIAEVTFTLIGADSQGTYPNGTKATVIVSGGLAGSTASVACKIKTATTPACIDERTVYLSIEDQ